MTSLPPVPTLPVGLQALVEKYGQSQMDAIQNSLVLKPQPPPVLDDLVDGDIVVVVKATEIVWTDTVMATGQYQHQARLPYAPGMTYSGTVVWASPLAQENGIKFGQNVAVAGDAGPRSLGKYQKWGGCASYAVAPYTACRQYPSTWSFEEAASFAYGYDTAYHCLIECGKIRQGETILIHGATGGVGTPAIHIAALFGLKIIATTRSPHKADFLHGLGVHHTILLSKEINFAQKVKELTNGKGVDIVYDGVGGDLTVESMKSMAFGGRLLIVGWASTPNVAKGGGQRGSPNANLIPTNLIMMKSLKVIGCPAMISAIHDKTLIPRRVKAITEWTMNGKLPPPIIAARYPLDQVKRAFDAKVQSGSQFGATVVIPPDLHIKPAKL